VNYINMYESLILYCKTTSLEQKLKNPQHGVKNGRYSGITDEEIVDYMLELTNIENIIPSMNKLREYVSQEYDRNIPKSFSKFRFPDKTPYKIVEDITGFVYNPWYKSKQHREKLSIMNKKGNI
jgi:hypothetical protein